MTEGVVLSTIVGAAGRSFPAQPRVRPDTAEDPARRASAARNDETTHRADPALPQRTPLLNGETQLAAQQAGTPTGRAAETTAGRASGEPADQPASGTGGESDGFDPSNPDGLTEEEQQKVRELQARDREVRAHEQAHKTAGGAHAGSPSFETEQGPDGKTYAVSGEVKIDTSPVPNNPDATIRKLEQVKRAALAPAEPSSQDRAVAAAADAKIQQARQEKQDKEAEAPEKAKDGTAGSEAGESGIAASEPVAGSEPVSTPSPIPAATSGDATPASPGSLFNLVA